MSEDNVNHPKHYTSHPSGVECIQITEHMDFVIGNIVKYAWRADLKNTSSLQDLEKCLWYAKRAVEREKAEIAKREQEAGARLAIWNTWDSVEGGQ